MSLTEPQVRAGARARVLVQRHEERELPAGLAVPAREVGRLGRHADRLRGGRVHLESQSPPVRRHGEVLLLPGVLRGRNVQGVVHLAASLAAALAAGRAPFFAALNFCVIVRDGSDVENILLKIRFQKL